MSDDTVYDCSFTSASLGTGDRHEQPAAAPTSFAKCPARRPREVALQESDVVLTLGDLQPVVADEPRTEGSGDLD